MCKRLEGRVALVTGAAGRLGTPQCLHLAAEGALVVVADRVDGQTTAETIRQAGGRSVYMNLDVTQQEDVQRVVREILNAFGHIDILVNNAGLTTGMRKPWIEFTAEDWDRKLAADVKGSFLCAQAVFPSMKAQRYGKIINIGSQVVVSAPPNFLPHVSAKAAVVGFTRALATEVGEFNINVNAILVGGYPPHPTPEQMKQQIETQALKRYPDLDDLAKVVVFLASGDSRWITGQSIAVCGGAVRTGG